MRITLSPICLYLTLVQKHIADRIGMDIVDEDGEGHLAATLNHATEQDGTSASEDTFTGPHINTMLTQEVVEKFIIKGDSINGND